MAAEGRDRLQERLRGGGVWAFNSKRINGGVVGISDHGGWAVLVTVAGDGTLLDRRRVALVDEGLPKMPHHSEGQSLSINEAVALVERVRLSAERHAKLALDAVALAVSAGIVAMTLRECPAWLPSSVSERIKNYRAQNVADWVMYRKAFAAAAEERGWSVRWYDAKTVLASASLALGIVDFDAHSLALRKSIGPPWDKDYKIALAAALTAATGR